MSIGSALGGSFAGSPKGGSVQSTPEEAGDNTVVWTAGLTTEDFGVIPAGTDLEGLNAIEIIERASRLRVAPTYTSPSLSISENVANTQQIGEEISITLTAHYTQNDAGAASNYRIQKRINSGSWTTIATASSYVDTVTIPEPSSGNTSSIQYRVLVDYAQGAILNDSYGDPNASGQIEADTDLTSGSKTITGVYGWYYGVDGSNEINSAKILAGNLMVADVGSNLSAAFAGTGYLWFAVPKGSKTFDTWYQSALNNGSIGTSEDLFNASVETSVNNTVVSTAWTKDFDVYITNYSTGGNTLTLS